MGEPFRAEIELLSLPDQIATLKPRLASPDLYPLTGFRYNSALSGARLNIRTHRNGRPVIEVVSARPLNEPFVYVLVELESDAKRIVRGYTALLDPQDYGQSRAASAAEYPPVGISSADVAVIPVALRKTSASSAINRAVPSKMAGAEDVQQVRRLEQQLDAGAARLAEMLDRVAALELAVRQMQRAMEVQRATVAVRKPATEDAPARSLNASPAVPVAASVESPQRPAPGQGSILNEALLVLVVGLLLLLAGLAWVVWGRPAVKARSPQGGQ